MLFVLILFLRESEELKAPRHASAAATRNGNLPHVTATYYTWRQYALYSDHLPLFPTISTIYILFLYLYSINLLISISYLLTFNLFLLSSIFRNIGYSFLKYLGGNKIYNKFIIRLSKAFAGKSYNCYINILGF